MGNQIPPKFAPLFIPAMQGENLWLRRLSNWAEKTRRVPAWVALFGALVAVFNYGFSSADTDKTPLSIVYLLVLFVSISSIVIGYFSDKIRPKKLVWLFDAFYIVLLGYTVYDVLGGGFRLTFNTMFIAPIMFLILIRELSTLPVTFSRDVLNPAQLFLGSFAAIIMLGAFFLMLPNATVNGISFIDSLFTATSAVCVTGLIVVDTGSYFTTFGQVVIMVLIQLGGLGIMTFTGFFSHFFRGKSSYENQLVLSNITNTSAMDEVFKTVRRIVLITFIIELFGAVFIYFSIDPAVITSFGDRAFFAGFHAISAFCNAGFSTLENSLYELPFRYNYSLQLIIALLFIVGGIGFPIVFNSLQYVRYLIVNLLLPFSTTGHVKHRSHVINLNSRIVLITTGILLSAGTLLFLTFEYNNTLAEHSGFGKFVVAFFGAATPRTAGFNSVDTSLLNFHTIMIVFFLMWVGASPGSTGGGLKTSTLALGTLNFLSVASGKSKIELFKREIPQQSVRRASAIIALSLIAIGTSVFFISLFDPDKELLPIAFESFSAYSTVGLSLGITAELSEYSRVIIIITMFVGRVTLLTFLAAFLRKEKYSHYRYPKEDILIN